MATFPPQPHFRNYEGNDMLISILLNNSSRVELSLVAFNLIHKYSDVNEYANQMEMYKGQPSIHPFIYPYIRPSFIPYGNRSFFRFLQKERNTCEWHCRLVIKYLLSNEIQKSSTGIKNVTEKNNASYTKVWRNMKPRKSWSK